MFQFHDRTRRRITLLAFFFLCALPTILVAAWGVSRRLVGHVGSEARRLGQRLGVKVTLEGVEHLRPGKVVYKGLALVDPETGATLLECRQLEAQWQKSFHPNGEAELALALSASQPEVHISQLDLLWRVMENVLVRQSEFGIMGVRLAALQTVLVFEGGLQSLAEVQGRVHSTAEQAQAELGFEIPGLEMTEPARIRVVRNRSTAPPTTALEFATGGAGLPCRLLAFGMQRFGSLGSNSTFCGRMWAGGTPEGWDGRLTGQFAAVDLAELFRDSSTHCLSGTTQVTVDTLRVRDGRILELAGSASAGPGNISRSLIEAAVRYASLHKGLDRTTSEALLPYGQLALRFLLDPAGLELAGQCSSPSSGVILADEYGPILGNPPPGPIPLVNLVQTLVPPDEPQISATRQTERLLRRLPIPERSAELAGIGQAEMEPVKPPRRLDPRATP